MRKRGRVFQQFQEVTGSDVVKALAALNANLKLVLEILCDLRVNTSSDPRMREDESRNDSPTK